MHFTRNLTAKNARSENTHWSVCPECHGEGKVNRLPTRKARLRYQRALIIASEGNMIAQSKESAAYIDDCGSCRGTGLKKTTEFTPPKTNNPTIAIIGAGIGGLALAVA